MAFCHKLSSGSFALYFRTPTEWHVSKCHKSYTFADKQNFDASLFLLSNSKSFFFVWMMAWLYMLLSHSPCRYILFGSSEYTEKICTHINSASGRFNLLKIFANLRRLYGCFKKRDLVFVSKSWLHLKSCSKQARRRLWLLSLCTRFLINDKIRFNCWRFACIFGCIREGRDFVSHNKRCRANIRIANTSRIIQKIIVKVVIPSRSLNLLSLALIHCPTWFFVAKKRLKKLHFDFCVSTSPLVKFGDQIDRWLIEKYFIAP
jgi:hypothetical protein